MLSVFNKAPAFWYQASSCSSFHTQGSFASSSKKLSLTKAELAASLSHLMGWLSLGFVPFQTALGGLGLCLTCAMSLAPWIDSYVGTGSPW